MPFAHEPGLLASRRTASWPLASRSTVAAAAAPVSKWSGRGGSSKTNSASRRSVQTSRSGGLMPSTRCSRTSWSCRTVTAAPRANPDTESTSEESRSTGCGEAGSLVVVTGGAATRTIRQSTPSFSKKAFTPSTASSVESSIVSCAWRNSRASWRDMSCWRNIAFLPSRMTTGDFAASFLAHSSTAASNSALATTRFTMPASLASCALIRSPSSSIWLAVLRGTFR